VKPAPAILVLIAGAALAGWLLTLLPSPVQATAGVEIPTWVEYATRLLCRLLDRATDFLSRL